MKLKSLEIKENRSYEPNPGKYTAEIEYEGESGSVKLQLDPDVSVALLSVIGTVISQFAHKAAEKLEREIKLSVKEAKAQPLIAETKDANA